MSEREVNMHRQLGKIRALLDELGIPRVVMFDDEPGKERTDLPARVEWALLALAAPQNVRVVERKATP
jgi:hypothetical protein